MAHRVSRIAWGAALVILAAPALAREQRVIVGGFYQGPKERYQFVPSAASEAVERELTRSGAFEVIARQEVERLAKARKMERPFSEEDLNGLAKEAGADLVVTGEVHHADLKGSSAQREAEVGLIVRVRDVALGEVMNGAAERGSTSNAPNGKKSDVILLMDATEAAAARAVVKIASYHPIEGTILSTAGRGALVMNRGSGHGVKGKQEFLVFRGGVRVGRLRVSQVRPSYSELVEVENVAGIRPEDKAISVFPEPKFGR